MVEWVPFLLEENQVFQNFWDPPPLFFDSLHLLGLNYIFAMEERK